ncbi:MAG: hypothetical protein HKN58_00505 [Xanthomonadales bacterium]|nr:hypothetical protein [Xanthomonadales bacterium]
MLTRIVWVAAITLATMTPHPALGLKTAAMKLPPGFAEQAQRLPVSGYGGANRGRFTVAEFRGEFTRIESRLGVFDPLFVSNHGSASYSMQGAEPGGAVGAECRFRQKVVTVGIVTFDPKKFVYDCELTSGGAMLPGRLALGEPKKEGFKQKFLAYATRRGEAEIGNMRIGIESVHEYAGTRLKAPTPVGYLLTLDGETVGALELTDVNPVVYLAGGLAEAERLSVLRAAIAVSLLRDPADSTLGD